MKRCHSPFKAGCAGCQEWKRHWYSKETDRTEPARLKGHCICGCGQLIGSDFNSYASTDCMFRGAKAKR